MRPAGKTRWRIFWAATVVLAAGLMNLVLIDAQEQGRRPPHDPLEGPWNHDLWLLESDDGMTFENERRILERGGVPCAIREKTGRIVAVFQWFPFDRRDAFDKVAVAFSKDDGATWTDPEPIRVEGLPEEYMRPFDPTIVVLDNGRFRLYFTSQSPAHRRPAIYSATSEDAVHYTFEPGVRSAGARSGVVDACAIRWRGMWHLYAHPHSEPGPRGRPLRSAKSHAYHAVSKDGLLFRATKDIPVPDGANWIGNVIEMNRHLRFFGSGRGGVWSAYSRTGYTWTVEPGLRARGGDPTVFRTSDGRYRMILTGPRREDASEPPFWGRGVPPPGQGGRRRPPGRP